MQLPHNTQMIAWRSVLPDSASTALLKSCLAIPKQANLAWQQFEELTYDTRGFFESNYHGLKGLLAFVAFNLERNQVEVNSKFMTYARVALVREELRAKIYYGVVDEICTVLETDKIAFSLLKGAANGTRLFTSPYIRHNHAIDILVSVENLAAAHSTLQGKHFTRDMNHPNTITHSTGLPLVLHTRAVDHPYGVNFNVPLQSVEVEGRKVQILGDTENLYATIANAAFSSGNRNLRWMVDTSLIIAQCTIDWHALVKYADADGLGCFFACIFEYLNHHQLNEVPQSVIIALKDTSITYKNMSHVLFSSLLITHNSHRRVWLALEKQSHAQLKFLLFAILPPASFVSFRQHYSVPSQVVRWHILRPYRTFIHVIDRLKTVA